MQGVGNSKPWTANPEPRPQPQVGMPTLALFLTHSLTLTLSFTLSLSSTLTLSLSHSLTLSLTHCHSRSLSLAPAGGHTDSDDEPGDPQGAPDPGRVTRGALTRGCAGCRAQPRIRYLRHPCLLRTWRSKVVGAPKLSTMESSCALLALIRSRAVLALICTAHPACRHEAHNLHPAC